VLLLRTHFSLDLLYIYLYLLCNFDGIQYLLVKFHLYPRSQHVLWLRSSRLFDLLLKDIDFHVGFDFFRVFIFVHRVLLFSIFSPLIWFRICFSYLSVLLLSFLFPYFLYRLLIFFASLYLMIFWSRGLIAVAASRANVWIQFLYL
jgi:hypothetical protein